MFESRSIFAKSCWSFLLLVALVCFNPVHGQNSLKSGLVGFYQFNQNTADSSGNEHHAAGVGGFFTADRFGDPDAAYRLYGNGTYIEIPAMINLQEPQWAYAIWFRIGALPTEKSDAFLLSYKGVELGEDVHVFVDDEDNMIKTFFENEFDKVSTGVRVEKGRWYHVVLNYKPGNIVQLFVDGVLRRQHVIDFTSKGDSSLIIGSVVDVSPLKGRIEGTVDDVCIYDRPLSASEVDLMYKSQSKDSLWTPPTPVFYRVLPTVCRCNGLSIETDDQIKSSMIYTIDGRFVGTANRIAEREYWMDVSRLTSGIYVIVSEGATTVYRDKVVVVR